MRIFVCCFAMVLFAIENSWAQTEPSTQQSPSERTYTLARWEEDYRFLADPAQRTDFWDPIKYVPLNAAGDWYASFGGQVRERYEYFNDYAFGAGPQTHDGYLDTRLTENADLHFGPYLRVFLQEASALETGRNGGPRANDRDEADLEQGFADLKIPLATTADLTLRVGRQYLEFGAARLIGPADFSNARKTFDGLRADLDSPDNSLVLFVVHPVVVEPYRFDSSDDNNALAGAYDTLQLPQLLPNAHTQLGFYELYLDRQNTTFSNETVTGTEDRYTSGFRLTSNPKPFDFDLEPDYQYGTFSGNNIRAFGIATKDGYTFSHLDLMPRAFLGADVASGTSRAHGGDVGTFNELYPSGHGQFGNIDTIGRQNIIDVEPGLDLTLLEHEKYVESLKLRTSFYEFWRQSIHDDLYNSAPAVVRTAGTSDARYIGSELDFLFNWQLDPHLYAYLGYSHFFAGEFITQTGTRSDTDFFYTAVAYTF
ncbi:MAG TPA: alginate export family protein [Tepidisphaeraceae bacterium]|nr:alginate export family protein [Tepidisphaeraceae bacterium]